MVLWIVLGLFYVVSLAGVFFWTKKRYGVKLSEVNSLLSEILEIHFKNNSLSGAAQSILVVLKRFYGVDYITILLYNESSNALEVIASNVDSSYLKYIEDCCNNTLKTLGKSDGKVITSKDGYLLYETASDRKVSFSSFTPLRFNGKLIGAILLEGTNASVLDNKTLRYQLYDKVFTSTALVLQNVLYTEKLVKLTSIDPLTGVYNRRYIDMTLPEQLNVHRNLGMSCTVVLFDIDHFKSFNDTYGHAFGDLVLKGVASYVKKSCGDNAWIARYGGEEFLLFFGRKGYMESFKIVERLREGISRLHFSDGNVSVQVTASFGVACFPNHGDSASDLIARADEALYLSKKNGRNRVTLAQKA